MNSTWINFLTHRDQITRREAHANWIDGDHLKPRILSYPVYMHTVGVWYHVRPVTWMSPGMVYRRLCDHIGVMSKFRHLKGSRAYNLQGLALKSAENIFVPALRILIQREGLDIAIWYEGSIPLASPGAVSIPVERRFEADVMATLLIDAGIGRPEAIQRLGADCVEFICFLDDDDSRAVSEHINSTTHGHEEVKKADHDPNGKKKHLATGKSEIDLEGIGKLDIRKKVYRIDSKKPWRFEVSYQLGRKESRNRIFRSEGLAKAWPNLLAELIEPLYEVGARPHYGPTPRVKFPCARPQPPRWNRTPCWRLPHMEGKKQQDVVLAVLRNGGKIERSELTKVLPGYSRSSLANELRFLERCGVLRSEWRNGRRVSSGFCEQFNLDAIELLLGRRCEHLILE
jgi:hypothetical protein